MRSVKILLVTKLMLNWAIPLIPPGLEKSPPSILRTDSVSAAISMRQLDVDSCLLQWRLTARTSTCVSLGWEWGRGGREGGRGRAEQRRVCVQTDCVLWMCVFSWGRATLVPPTPPRDPLQLGNNGGFNALRQQVNRLVSALNLFIGCKGVHGRNKIYLGTF